MAADKITCKDCGQPFYFTERDQGFFKEKGWDPPKRCRDCRRQRKAAKEAGQGEGGAA